MAAQVLKNGGGSISPLVIFGCCFMVACFDYLLFSVLGLFSEKQAQNGNVMTGIEHESSLPLFQIPDS
jgi:hypothetical protein